MAKNSKHPRFVKKEAISFGFNIAKKNILFFLGLFVIWAFFTIITSAIRDSLIVQRQILFSFIFSLLVWVVGIILSMGFINITLEFVDGKKPAFKDLYYTTKLFNYIVASIIKGVIVVFGLLLLIIPGIIFAIKLQFTGYLIVDKKLDFADALKGSWEITKGAKWNLFLLAVLLGLINILGLLCLLVGLLISVPLAMVAEAYVYRKLLSQTNLK
jgi:uncharacterized membrane protein